MKADIPFETEKQSEVFYDGLLCGQFRLDIVVDDRIVLELKALAQLTNDHLAQVLSYLKATGLKLEVIPKCGMGVSPMRRRAILALPTRSEYPRDMPV